MATSTIKNEKGVVFEALYINNAIDLDTLISSDKQGFYFINNVLPTHSPSDISQAYYGTLVFFTGTQMLFTGSEFYVRVYRGTSWKAWKKVTMTTVS